MTVKNEVWTDLSEYREGNYLEHYGRLGMKWGQHIFGKESSSSEGNKGSKAKTQNGIRKRILQRSSKKEQETNQKKLEKAARKAEKAEAKAAKLREDILKSPTRLYKNRDKYTQEEINNALKRFEWEKRLRDYSNAELEAGKKYIDAAFQYTNSAINLYNQAARVVNTFNLSDVPWRYVESIKTDKDKKKGS